MDCQYLPLDTTGQFSTFFVDYITQNPALTPFYNRFPSIDAFGPQIQQKKTFPAAHRQTLVSVLERQYAGIQQKPDFAVLNDPNTFTVTSGHQLNIFTGPLYVVYKLVTIINLAKKLKETYPDYNFVPVYWMATEDHDFDEINHFSLFGRKHTWQTTQKGAVGRMNPAELADLFKTIPEKLFLFEEAYLKHDTLADAARYYMNELFGSEGLICLDADDADLKKLFTPVLHEELFQQASAGLVQQTTQELETLGYHSVISPRDINLFYLDDQLRERIERKENGSFSVVNTKLTFTAEEMDTLVAEYPEKLSPNVVLRPVYQETILPNLAYIGGPSEVPYWMQLKSVFDHYNLPFPILMPRNFALYVPRVSAKRIARLGITPEDLFRNTFELKRDFVEQHAHNALKFGKESKLVNQALEMMLQKAMLVDPTLEKAVLAETKRFANAVTNLEKKMRRAEERNQAVGVSQLLAVKNELFPGDGLQERSENYLTFYLNDKDFLKKLLHNFDPFDFRMQICLES
ncbi:bacillithiol biosynthesis cysteine-adding enzyme BshC [Arsenicibacter rosenii]|uniref:Putative cysteine ligase BshC n=1 Tax=Arsenicibacter rosenii TaxID=1750698 RepID=A0A1S2VE14_9BACT|nr:bacillithiol biosynthesis cysteine-adding enzyme BshC [Arsenicibacter rosenii]OIN56997.1 bacillithiol biosynthesis cysteine-adding enzyme BshC [Arsenicibacter rosenii]